MKLLVPAGVRIREAAPEDCDALLALYCEVHDRHLAAQPEEFDPLTPEEEARLIREFAQGDKSHLYVAEDDKGLIGCVRFEVHAATRGRRHAKRYLYINMLVVAPKWQDRGIGAALLERVHTFARASGLDEITLDVHEFNRDGQRLYERMGYQTMVRRMKLRLDRS